MRKACHSEVNDFENFITQGISNLYYFNRPVFEMRAGPAEEDSGR
jgi:hypothetical protein